MSTPAKILAEATIPIPTGTLNLQFEAGTSTVIIGANGSGKTRLGVYLDQVLSAKDVVHRIAAQKMLALDEVQVIALEYAEAILRYGMQTAHPTQRINYRWQNRPVTHLLNDFQALLQTLFAQHDRTAVKFLDEHQQGGTTVPPKTTLQKVRDVWERLLPHRKLELLEAGIQVTPVRLGTPADQRVDPYRAAEMSDGERAIFYLLGQCFVARPGSVLVIDEPEGHVHKAIINKVWDAIEAERPDCAFVYFTHDLDFASRRAARAKYFLRSFDRISGKDMWEIEPVPCDSGLPEHIISEIVGSRRPILFVEGTGSSLDITTYRELYNDFTVTPIGNCESVIHAVESFRKNTALHSIGAKGLVDADSRSAEEIALLAKLDVHVLPVAEIENVFLLPTVFAALASALYHTPEKAAEMLRTFTDKVVLRAGERIEEISVRHTIRRLDSSLKRVGVTAKDLPTLTATYSREIAAVDPAATYAEMKDRMQKGIASRDLSMLLSVYDNKGLFAEAAVILGLRDKEELQNLISRLLPSPEGLALRTALASEIPTITP